MATIVCAIDDSPGALAALAAARTLSGSLDVRLVLAHAAHGWSGVDHAGSVSTNQGVKGGQTLLERAAREHQLDAERRVEVGEPVEVLARIAAEEGASMIVVGSRRQGFGRQKLRSGVAGELAATAPCPVLVVPPPPRG